MSASEIHKYLKEFRVRTPFTSVATSQPPIIIEGIMDEIDDVVGQPVRYHAAQTIIGLTGFLPR